MKKEKLLEFIKDLISKYSKLHGKIEFEREFIQKYLFIENDDNTKTINDDFFNVLRANSCDMAGISFKNVHIKAHYFNGLKNVEININEIPDKDISGTNLDGVKVTGSLDGANIRMTLFKGYKGSLILNPQLVKNKDLHYVDLDGITVDGSFDDCYINMIRFKGANGIIKINPQKVKDKDISNIDFEGVELIGDPIENTKAISYKEPSFDDCIIHRTSFSNCKGHIVINPQLVKGKRLILCDLSNVELVGSLEGVDFYGSKLSEFNEVKINFEKSMENKLENSKVKKFLFKRK